jgi:hypothetical protein
MKTLKLLKSNKGSSSILLILILITLVVLGVTALVSSFADLKLARKNAEWMKNYYQLDSEAEKFVSNMDSCLLKAVTNADNYNKYKCYLKPEVNGISAEIQKSIAQGWLICGGNKEKEQKFTEITRKKLYFYYAASYIKAYSKENNYSVKYKYDILNDAEIFSREFDIPAKDIFKVSTNVTGIEENDNQNLEIEINILYPDNVDRAKGLRYEITKWKQKQLQKVDAEIDDNLELWDGKVD